MTRMKPFFLIFKEPAVPHKIRLLKSKNHFDGCTSFPAFVNRSYHCLDCEKGFNTNDKKHHACQGIRCRACSRFDCPDYVRCTRPTDYFTHCNSHFYGPQCKCKCNCVKQKKNLCEVPGPVHCHQRSTSPVRICLMSHLSWVGFHSRPQELHSIRRRGGGIHRPRRLIWSMLRTVMKSVRLLWCFTTWEISTACSSCTNSTINSERWWITLRWAPKCFRSRANPSNSSTHCIFYPCRWHLFRPHSIWRN